MLGASRRVTRIDRELARGRCQLLGTEAGRLGPLAQLATLAKGLGLEFVEGSAEPLLIYQENEHVDPEPYQQHLESRRDLLIALCRRDRSVEDADDNFDQAISSLQCVRKLAEAFGAEERPIPSAWGRRSEGEPPKLLIDVDAVGNGSRFGELAWAIAGVFGSFDRLTGYMAILGAPTDAGLKAVARALGIGGDEAPVDLPSAAQHRLAWLAALSEGCEVTARAESLLADADWPGADGLKSVPLPASLGRSRVLFRGWLDHAAVIEIGQLLTISDWHGGRRMLLDRARLEFRPSPGDLIGAVPNALRLLSAQLAWADDPNLEGVSNAITALDSRLGSLDLRVADALGKTDFVDSRLARAPVWGRDTGLAQLLIDAADALGELPGEVLELLGCQGEEERRERLAEREHDIRARREVAAQQRWDALGADWSLAAPLQAGALETAGRGQGSQGAGSGPSVKASERGAVGELLALRDVIGRLLRLFREDADTATGALHAGLTVAREHRSSGDQDEPLSVDALRSRLTLAAEGDREALEELAARLDLSAVRGPGFDVIDPLGPIIPGPGPAGPARIEVKTTAEPLPPGGTVTFRLTVNELFRAQRGATPYIIRVYHDPGEHGLPTLAAEIADPASLVGPLQAEEGRALLAAVRGGGHLILTAKLGG